MSTSDSTTKTVRRMFSEGPRVNSGLMEGSPVDASRLRYRAARGPAPRRGRRAADPAVLSLFDHNKTQNPSLSNKKKHNTNTQTKHKKKKKKKNNTPAAFFPPPGPGGWRLH